MVSGHFATALVAKRVVPTARWWLLLLSAGGLDLLMFVLVRLGIERFEDDPNVDGPSITRAVIEMTYSHDLLPVLGWTVVFGAVVWLGSRSAHVALVCTVLFFGHWVCDLVSGYGHFVFGPDSVALGTDWYHTNLAGAIAVEIVLSLVCVALATTGTSVSVGRRALLFAVFGLTPLSYLVG